ncbi:CBS domain-containing protein [Streptomyces sp. WMMB 322]|uniref:CBS domain-containing protein n=1 Tax=Streptomyces sp. WMMB 322 TaxID=1286821 RepID=UPI0006E2D703|nr:CBS domain-containing protein [Streptomyces sp. WMMB 322]SCK09181.1 BON domain-containing protein [Streptomyces sp. WMMB 322]
MPYRTVGELMTSPGLGVHRSAAADEAARLLDEHGLSALPVVDDNGCPVGVVSRKDLRERLDGARTARGAAPYPSRGLGHPPGAVTADAVMTSPAVTARPGWTVSQAARTMDRRRVKWLPVVDEATDRLVGFLSRGDLLRVFVRTDRAVRQEIARDVLDRTLGIGPTQVTVTVAEGRVTLQGIVERRALLPVVDRLTRGVDGVVDVRNHLAYLNDAPPGSVPSAAGPALT